MRVAVTAVFVALLLVGVSFAEEEADVEAPSVMISLRACSSDLKETPKSVIVLSAPTIVTRDGQQATFVVGGEHALKEHEEGTVTHGVRCEVKPRLLQKDKVLLVIRWEFTELVDEKREGAITAQGTCFRSSLIIKPGEKVRLGSTQRDGKKTWMEATVNVIEPGEVIARR